MRAVGATRELNKQSGEKHGAQRNTGRSGPRELAILMRGKSTGHAENTGGRGDRKSTRLNSSHIQKSRMPSSA